MSRDGTVTGHNEVTLKSETGSFDEHAEVIQAQKLCEKEKKQTPGGTTTTRVNMCRHIQGARDELSDCQGQPIQAHSPG